MEMRPWNAEDFRTISSSLGEDDTIRRPLTARCLPGRFDAYWLLTHPRCKDFPAKYSPSSLLDALPRARWSEYTLNVCFSVRHCLASSERTHDRTCAFSKSNCLGDQQKGAESSRKSRLARRSSGSRKGTEWSGTQAARKTPCDGRDTKF